MHFSLIKDNIKMNRKKKINDLFKGGFRNDKKSCLIDLKPLEDKCEGKQRDYSNCGRRSLEHFSNYPQISKEKTSIQKEQIAVNIKVAKNLGFGTFFQKLREEIVDIFLSKDEMISLDKMFNQKGVNDLFNFKESKQMPMKENIPIMNSISNPKPFIGLSSIPDGGLSFFDQPTVNYENEEILYEDEESTIFKRKKTKSKMNTNNMSIYIPKVQGNPIYYPPSSYNGLIN